MKIPKDGSRKSQIRNKFLESGAMTPYEFIANHTMMDFRTIRDLKNELTCMNRDGYLRRTGNSFWAEIEHPKTANSSEKGQPVEPRTAPEFREIDSKYLPPAVSPRGQPLRNISFIGLGDSNAEPNRF